MLGVTIAVAGAAAVAGRVKTSCGNWVIAAPVAASCAVRAKAGPPTARGMSLIAGRAIEA